MSTNAAAACEVLAAYNWASGEAGYRGDWFFPFPLEPQAERERGFVGGRLQLAANPFTISGDAVGDAPKYYAQSAANFDLPAVGSLSVRAEIEARTSGVDPGHVVPTAGRALLEGQHASATLHLIDLHQTGLVLDWLVSETRAFVLYERLQLPSVAPAHAFTQIVAEFEVDPGSSHMYEIRYKRRADGGDEAHWLLDSEPQATFGELGIPLDAPARHDRRAIGVYPSRGSGEPLAGKLTSFSVAHGLFSLVGEFPFTEISIPATERIFGQGIEASFGPVSVERSAA